MKVTKQHLDAALEGPWSSRTCLLNQTLVANGKKPRPMPDTEFTDQELAAELMFCFDSATILWDYDWNILAMLRAMLPMEV